MANSVHDGDSMDINPYRMHVSARYLDLTKRKLELTRLPREITLPDERRWALGTPKETLEPLIDYWLEVYDWRHQEEVLNNALPQYRTSIYHHDRHDELKEPPNSNNQPSLFTTKGEALRIHFVHKQSPNLQAIPLLYCHGWPGSFLEISRAIDALTNPVGGPGELAGPAPSFHVVVPSIPGFAFSDASSTEGFGLSDTADVFVELMERLGYKRFIIYGDGWGYKVSKVVSAKHPESVMAMFTSSPMDLPRPTFSVNRMAWLKWRIARATRARWLPLAFGYTPQDFSTSPPTGTITPSIVNAQTDPNNNNSKHPASATTVEDKQQLTTLSTTHTLIPPAPISRPQTLAYSLCDSPSGLLSLLLDAIQPALQPPPTTPTPSNPSPATSSAWSTNDILSFTMMHWLPGPEAALRWLNAAAKEDCFQTYCNVPLGVSQYKGSAPALWASMGQRLQWVRRRGEEVPRLPAWEKGEQVVVDLRDFVREGLREGWVNVGVGVDRRSKEASGVGLDVAEVD